MSREPWGNGRGFSDIGRFPHGLPVAMYSDKARDRRHCRLLGSISNRAAYQSANGLIE